MFRGRHPFDIPHLMPQNLESKCEADYLFILASSQLSLQPCKIDSENWTYFRFHFQRVSFRSLIVELTNILDKTQVWPRKSILYVRISQTLITKYF